MLALLLPQAEQLGILPLMIQRGYIFVYSFYPSSPTLLSSALHPPWAQRSPGANSAVAPSPRTGLFPPCHQHRGLSQRFPTQYSWPGLAGSAADMWKWNLKWILLEVAGLPVGFEELISINMSYFATLNKIFPATLNQMFPVIQYLPHHVFLSFAFQSQYCTFEGVPASFSDHSWSSVCWSRCSWNKLYPHQKVKCDDPGAQVLNVVCLDWSE